MATQTMKRYVAGLFILSLLSFYPVSQARAQSIESLQQQINQLLATVAALQAQLGGIAGTCSANFTRDLSIGVTGSDVLALQKFLNRSTDTRLAQSGAGSPGMETSYYGAVTAAAVSKFQVKYRSEILSPSGLVNPTGYFGSASRAKANALCSVVVTPTPNPTNPGQGTTDALRGGEARLEAFSADEGDDTSIAEGQNNAPVMDVEFDVEDGDVQINRIDVALDHISGGDSDPWDVFETLAIFVDGKKVAEMNVGSRSAWSQNQPKSGDYRVRISTIKNFIVREGQTAEFTVALTPANNVDDAGSVEWEIFIPDDGIRAIDSERINHFIGDTDQTVRFDINEAGADADLVIRTSDDDPDAMILNLNRSSNSNWLSVFAFELDADDSADDLTINTLPLTVEVDNAQTYNALVRGARVVIDGKTYDNVSVTGGTTDTAVLTFNLGRNGHKLDAGDTHTVFLQFQFRPLAEVDEGTQIRAFITSAQADEIDAEGRDDLSNSQISGSASGESHTLRTGGSSLGSVTTSATLKPNSTATVDDDEGVFVIKFDITAFGEDLYINRATQMGTTTGTAGINYVLKDSSGVVVNTGTSNAALSSNANLVEGGSMYRILEGQTRSFTLTVNYDPTTRDFYQLQLYSINYNDTATNPDTFQRVLPESRYQTQTLSI